METVPLETDVTNGSVLFSADETPVALSEHMEPVNSGEEIAEYTYSDYVREHDVNLDNAIYTPMDNREAFQTVYSALSEWGHHPIGAAHKLSRGGKRYGALIAFLPQNPKPFQHTGYLAGYTPLVFLRNSYDKTYPLDIRLGAHLHRANVLWLGQAEVGQRRHTKKFEQDLSDVVTEWMDRLDDLLIEQDHRFGAYQEALIPDLPHLHNRIFQAYDAGVLPKSYLPTARDAFIDAEGTEGPWRLFTVMQYALRTRRGKDVHQYWRFCSDYEEELDRDVGFQHGVRLAAGKAT
jgi:hypothetical protein